MELDAEKIAGQIKRLIDDEQLREQLGQNAAKLNFGDEKALEKITELMT